MEQVSDFRRTAWVVNDGAIAVRLVGDRRHAQQRPLHPGQRMRIGRPEQEILASMARGGIATVGLAEGPGQGIVALSGGSLAYAVLCPSATVP
jgi:ferric-dicitrate binding protein FerR (iron transport regulator)